MVRLLRSSATLWDWKPKGGRHLGPHTLRLECSGFSRLSLSTSHPDSKKILLIVLYLYKHCWDCITWAFCNVESSLPLLPGNFPCHSQNRHCCYTFCQSLTTWCCFLPLSRSCCNDSHVQALVREDADQGEDSDWQGDRDRHRAHRPCWEDQGESWKVKTDLTWNPVSRRGLRRRRGSRHSSRDLSFLGSRSGPIC